MSEQAYERRPLADDIFGSSAITNQTVPYPQYGPSSRPLAGGEPKLFATVAGHDDMPILEYDDGRRVVRVPRIAAVRAPVNEMPRAEAGTLDSAAVAPLDSIKFNLTRSHDGSLSGEFAVKGDFIHFLEVFAGAKASSNKSIAGPARQLESSIAPTQSTPQRVVAPMPLLLNEAPQSENDNDWSGHEPATIADHGLKKVIKGVLRPRLAGAVLALSVAVAGGAYRLESGELPIHGNPIDVLQSDINQVIHHPIQTIAAQIGKL